MNDQGGSSRAALVLFPRGPAGRAGAFGGGLLAALAIGLILLSILAGSLVYLFKGRLTESAILENEESIARLLEGVAAAESLFRQYGQMDVDGDGKGEYGYLQELTGVAWRTTGEEPAVPSRYLDVPGLGQSAAEHGGIASWRGYYLLVYLPGPTAAIPESVPLPESDLPGPVADGQEKHWVAYAWPRVFGSTGRSAFVVGEEEKILVTPNDEHPYQGLRDHVPEASAAFDSMGTEPANLRSGLAWFTGGTAVDGREWTPVEE